MHKNPSGHKIRVPSTGAGDAKGGREEEEEDRSNIFPISVCFYLLFLFSLCSKHLRRKKTGEATEEGAAQESQEYL